MPAERPRENKVARRCKPLPLTVTRERSGNVLDHWHGARGAALWRGLDVLGEARTDVDRLAREVDVAPAQREQLAESQRNAAQGQQALGTERQARLDADKRSADSDARAKAAQDALAKLAAVKEDDRGMVITLSGSVLFPSDQSSLLPDAQTRLDQVAAALMATKERNIVIEGHTDSRGSETHNLDLSQRRAESVRSYLVSKGYESDRVQAHGIGKGRPATSNDTAEGRANNRRVEIIVQPVK